MNSIGNWRSYVRWRFCYRIIWSLYKFICIILPAKYLLIYAFKIFSMLHVKYHILNIISVQHMVNVRHNGIINIHFTSVHISWCAFLTCSIKTSAFNDASIRVIRTRSSQTRTCYYTVRVIFWILSLSGSAFRISELIPEALDDNSTSEIS